MGITAVHLERMKVGSVLVVFDFDVSCGDMVGSDLLLESRRGALVEAVLLLESGLVGAMTVWLPTRMSKKEYV